VYELYFNDKHILQDTLVGEIDEKGLNRETVDEICEILQREDISMAIERIMGDAIVKEIETRLNLE